MNSLIATNLKNKVGFITLNNEKSLNALSLTMAKELFHQLESWKDNDQVACIFLQGAGTKAFCAGGDVRKLFEVMKTHPRTNPPIIPTGCIDFFEAEYSVDYLIHVYPKPIIVWGDGIVMGGGIGLMNGASHRIVTEKSMLAMPEITIGLYPDVGATWFLNRMPTGFGMFMGMTAARVGASDAIFLKLADHYLTSAQKSELLEGLDVVAWEKDGEANRDLVTTLLKQIESVPEESNLKSLSPEMEPFAYIKTVAEFKQVADTLPQTEWIKKCLDTFSHGSPTSATVIIEQIHRGKNLSLEEVFEFEMSLSLQFTLRPDFEEGVRALLVDKDQSPKWVAAEKVTKEWVDGHFEKLSSWSPTTAPSKLCAK